MIEGNQLNKPGAEAETKPELKIKKKTQQCDYNGKEIKKRKFPDIPSYWWDQVEQ